MFFCFDRIAVLSKDVADYFRAFHCDGERMTFTQMIGTGIVGPVRLHHRDRAKIEIGVTVWASLRELLDDLRCLTNRVPVNARLIGGNQIRVDADL